MEQNQGSRGRPINLNLLPVMRELLRRRNVTQAAAALNMSQSAVSDALSRLRGLFKDSLLIPSGRGFVLSRKAMELEPILLGTIEQIETLLDALTFNPIQASGRFHIAASDYASLLFGPPLIKRLITEAPDICLQFHGVDDGSLAKLASGQLDLMIIPDWTEIPPELELDRMFLCEDELVVIRSTDETGAKDGASLKLCAADSTHSDLDDHPDVSRPTIFRYLDEQHIETTVLPGFMLLPYFVENTSMAAAVQRGLIERLLPSARIRIAGTRYTFPKIRLFAIWARARNTNPSHRWLRELVVDLGADVIQTQNGKRLSRPISTPARVQGSSNDR